MRDLWRVSEQRIRRNICHASSKRKNKLEEDMILVANLILSASFRYKNKATIFFKIALGTLLFSCRVKFVEQRCFSNFQKQPLACSWKFHKFHRKTLVLEPFFNKAWGPANLFKRISNVGVFLWNLRYFWERLFWRTSANDCFWTLRQSFTLEYRIVGGFGIIGGRGGWKFLQKTNNRGGWNNLGGGRGG